MKKLLSLFLAAMLCFSTSLRADEGMWLLPLLEKIYPEMQKAGVRLTPEQIYSINHSSLKDAIVIFGGGCTGELVSQEGLILTNHHCGYSSIQYHSSVEHDYLKDGFWAMSRSEELPTPDLSVTFLESFTDVTDSINAAVAGITDETERAKIIRKKSEELAAPHKSKGVRAIVSSFYANNVYYLIVYKIYNDVRMVGAPPSSIGKFGGDTDNWMWPRHTGDFSMFRVYADKNGNPAEYSPDNVPFAPKQHLKVSIKGVENGDYTMIMGYPGRTSRYMTSWELDERMSQNANRISVRGAILEKMKEDMEADRKVRIQYSSKFASISNYWKNSIGMNKALKKLKIKDKKEAEQADFTNWVNASGARKAKYGEALSLIKNSVEGRASALNSGLYLQEAFFNGCESVELAFTFKGIFDMYKMQGGDSITVAQVFEKVNDAFEAEKFFKNYNMPTDKKVAKAALKNFFANADKNFSDSLYNDITANYGGDIDKMIDDVVDNSVFSSKEKYDAFIQSASKETLDNDKAAILGSKLIAKLKTVNAFTKNYNADFTKGRRYYEAGLLDKNANTPMYPDANSTMRLTYGNVKDYYPADAVHYEYYTTLDGVMQKEDPENLFEFEVPQRLKDLYAARDYGQYAMKNGKLPVAFLSTNDITGGNSGSPVMNAKGELIGLAFDGNWEAMSGDICFEPELQRCINVDIRYVLFIIDKYAGAGHLVKEMTIVK